MTAPTGSIDWPLTGISHDFQLLLYIYSLLPSTLDKCILPILQSEAPDQAHDLQFPKWLVPLAPFATVTLVRFGTCLLRTIISLLSPYDDTTTTTTIRLPPSGALFLLFFLILSLHPLSSFHSFPSLSSLLLTRSRARSPVCLLDSRKTRCNRCIFDSVRYFLGGIRFIVNSILVQLDHTSVAS